MKLSFEQIKEITQGAEDIKSTFDGIQFFRFTENFISISRLSVSNSSLTPAVE